MDSDTLLTTTRSVRRKLDPDRPVEPDILADCLRIAAQAPAAGAFAARFRWLIVDDPDTKKALAQLIRADGEASQARYGHLVPARTLASGRHLLTILERIPVYVLACLEGRPPADHATLTAYYGSVYPAVWSLQLALRSRGLGSTMVGYHLAEHEPDAARVLGIPDDVTQVAMLAVAHTTTDTFHPAARPPLVETTYHNRWGTPADFSD